jgi:Tfp pilus assembly protein PilF
MSTLYGKCQAWLTNDRGRISGLNLLLVLTTLLVYWPVGSHEFVSFDTPSYVTQNQHVNSGLSRENIVWAFTSTDQSNWHPLTWLSHMLDVQLFGLVSGPHHLVNLFFHILNSLLLFYLFRRLTKAIWPAALVAAIFALHPLRVESVAWVAERKDVLSGCFWMLTLISYCRYVEQPRVQRYLAVLLFFGLGLMAKSMLVTLPFVMLLLDYWPLGRFATRRIGQDWHPAISPVKLIGEKVPLFLLSIIASAITLYTQQKAGAVGSLENIQIIHRVVNALVSYVSYLGKMIWPANLAVFYPLRTLPTWLVLCAPLLLFFISFLAFRGWKSRPWFMVGWLWYLGTLVPVIGLVQVGSQAMADRYTYIPMIGISIIFAWSLAELAVIRPRLKPAIVTLTFVVLVMFAFTAKVQVGHWRNSTSLYEHALASAPNHYLTQYNLAKVLSDSGRLDEAAPHFAEALRLEPDSARHYYGYGLNLDRLGKISEAEEYYKMALQLDTERQFAPKLHVYLGVILAKKGLFAEASRNFQEALRLEPENLPALFFLGNAMLAQGKSEEALGYFSEAMRIDPRDAYALCGLGDFKFSQGQLEEAGAYFSEALRLAPGDLNIRSRVEFVRQGLAGRSLHNKE